MWEVSYIITPNRGYFDRAETVLLDAGIRIESVHSIEFVADGSVVMLCEVEGTVEALEHCLEAASGKVIDYAVARDCDPLVFQVRFYPSETFKQLLLVHCSFGVSIEFPIQYIQQDPSSVEIVEVGPRQELHGRIRAARDRATVHVQHIHRYDPSTGRRFAELTERQQEVLLTAARTGYYRNPRDATHEDIAAELGCCASTVGQHLRRIETQLITSILPDRSADAIDLPGLQ